MKKKVRILVVDDDPGILDFVDTSLSLSGFEVITASQGQEALELVKSACPDIILLDILMSPMDGLEVLDKLRTFSEVPVIIFTGRDDIAATAIEMGAMDSLAKPFSPAALERKIRDVLDCQGISASKGE